MTHLRSVPDVLLTKRELAGEMRISVPTLNRMRREARNDGDPMPEVTWGRRLVRFRRFEVMAWLENRYEVSESGRMRAQLSAPATRERSGAWQPGGQS